MGKTIEELRDYLLDNYIDEEGDLDLMGLDFSGFYGDIYLTGMKVNGDLYQGFLKIGGDLIANMCEVEESLLLNGSKIKGDFYCEGNEVGGKVFTNEPKKLLKEITPKELESMGYKLKCEEE